MKTVNTWLLTWTAGLLRHPRLFIMVPILSVFLLSYPAVYDYTLKPLNERLLTIFNDCALANGHRASFHDPHWTSSLAPNVDNLTITQLSFAGDNVLRYESLKELSDWASRVDAASKILSPLSFLPDNTISEAVDMDDGKQIEKCFLKILNYDVSTSVVSMFFDDFGKRNHVINSAQKIKIIVLSDQADKVLPEFNGISLTPISRSVLTTAHEVNGFISYFDTINKIDNRLNWVVYALGIIQTFFVIWSVLRVYLAIFNSHKVKSSIGLVIGWLNSVVISGFGSLALEKRLNLAVDIKNSSPPIHLLVFGQYVITVLILSSRNIFRTLNDLAGDSSFGEPESLHKRLIQFYLGFNSSVANSEGVFHISSFVRKIMCLDAQWFLTPVPNTTIILLINIVGISTTMALCALFFRFFLTELVWATFDPIFMRFIRLTVTTLIVDHILQLTYMVAIIIIDLHRIDLTDVLAKAAIDDNLDASSLHEVNPLSAKLLAAKSKHNSTWKIKLGTYFLKVSPHSPKYLWLKLLPMLCFCTCSAITVRAYLITNFQLAQVLDFFKQSNIIKEEIDALYFIELFTVMTLIVAISEITFALKFSEGQKQNLNSVVILSPNEMRLSELSNVDTTRKFEAITLVDHEGSEKLGLFSNPKAPLLVTIDVDHRICLWSSLSKTAKVNCKDISTVFEQNIATQQKPREFWPVNHVEVSNEGNYIMLINNRNCRIKCYSKNEEKYVWEISLTSEIEQEHNKMKPVLCFFRKKTVAGFFARELILRRKKLSGGSKRGSDSSLCTMRGNFPPPLVGQNLRNSPQITATHKDTFNREEFVMILETGEMITISCDSVKVKVYNLLAEVFSDENFLFPLTIESLKFLTTARVNDRIICTISNDELVIGSAVNNIWRFSRLKTNKVFTSNSLIRFAPPLMTRGTWLPSDKNPDSHLFPENRNSICSGEIRPNGNLRSNRFEPMNESTIVTIDFVGMFVRVKNLQAELIDIQTGTVLRLFHIGSFKPGSFRVSHSEPTHCKFCGCVSFEYVSLIYEDLYDPILIIHTFQLENKKSRNNICLRVERDPLEIRCLGFDSVIENLHWFNDIEKWELTDMNVIVGIRKIKQTDDAQKIKEGTGVEYKNGKKKETSGLRTLRNRKLRHRAPEVQETLRPLGIQWQGFVVTALNGKLLEYDIPMEELLSQNICSMRPNLIIKFGFKAVAIAFGHIIKIIYLGNDKLIENDLYYSGSASTIHPVLGTNSDGKKHLNELLFINKRRRTAERKIARSNDSSI